MEIGITGKVLLLRKYDGPFYLSDTKDVLLRKYNGLFYLLETFKMFSFRSCNC